MDTPLDEMTGGSGNSRRQFLPQLATTTAIVTAAAALPATAQENSERAEAKRGTSEPVEMPNAGALVGDDRGQ